MSVLLAGRAYDETLARELGREASESTGLRLGRGPNDKRLTPDVLSRGTCLPVVEAPWLLVGVVSSPATLAVEPVTRFRERMVTLEGTLWAP